MVFTDADMTIGVTRGDSCEIVVSAKNKTVDGVSDYVFQKGDTLRFRVFGKKNCENVLLVKDFFVSEPTTHFTMELSGADTGIGGLINKPVDYWYEIELNPLTNPQTIVGYDDDGAKIFRVYPESSEAEDESHYIPPTEEELKTIDEKFAEIDRTIIEIQGEIDSNSDDVKGAIAGLKGDLDELTTDYNANKNSVVETNTEEKLSFWVGTEEEYKAIETPKKNCFYIISDDTKKEKLEKSIMDIEGEIDDVRVNFANEIASVRTEITGLSTDIEEDHNKQFKTLWTGKILPSAEGDTEISVNGMGDYNLFILYVEDQEIGYSTTIFAHRGISLIEGANATRDDIYYIKLNSANSIVLYEEGYFKSFKDATSNKLYLTKIIGIM